MIQKDWRAINRGIIRCRRCPRLVRWREKVARARRAAYAGETYWGRPITGFGDPAARLVVIGLAPGAHGANRTGRIFTGDRSGDWLFRALHKAGFANQPASVSRRDGLRLKDAYVTAVVRCAPPGNRPTPRERDHCIGYLVHELRLLKRAKVVLALGGFAWDGALRALGALGYSAGRPRFGHGATAVVGPYLLVGSYHPSQQNTFTGRLTEKMFDGIFRKARALLR